jgi:endonuclease G, mitochondrial
MDRKTKQQLVRITAFVVAVLVFLLLQYLTQNRNGDRPPPSAIPGQADASVHLALGNPSGATDDINNPDNYLMRKPYFALSYNNSRGTPNWVSWKLQRSDLGPAPRSQFYPDSELPRSFKHVTPNDYTGSGFDRGHMCPRSDRTATNEMSNATFVMTNIIPQAPSVNQKAWADLEDYCRHLVERKSQTLYIVSGPQGEGGIGSKGPAEKIGHGKVTVPAKCWKVIVVLDEAGGNSDDAGRVSAGTRVITVLMPNEESVGHGWAKYRTSVQEVESLTGYRFFDRVPAEISDPLKTKVDSEHIPASHSRRSED